MTSQSNSGYERDADLAILGRELAYHERLYAGFAQQHFAKAAVRALRRAMVARILRKTGANRQSEVLSLGCGVGDTEIALAPHVGSVTGVDVSPKGIAQARADSAGVRHVRFETGTMDSVGGSFDIIVAIFLLHHLPSPALGDLPRQVAARLKPGGAFYSLDPNRLRFTGWLGSKLCPALMKRYQSPDERELDPTATARLFDGAGFAVQASMFDFLSTPYAGLFPSSAAGYRVTRVVDRALVRIPGLRALGSNFEIVARLGKPRIAGKHF